MRIGASGEAPVDLARVRGAVRAALRPFGLPRDTEIGLAFVDDVRMRTLNRRHRGIGRTTDVLSFGQALPAGSRGAAAAVHLRREPDGTLQLGDIVISVAQARRQARRARRSLEGEVAFLAAHGALHLLGFEDETPFGYREMVRLGKEAVRKATPSLRTR
ncbi:MAG TPA: rRNA maturation RNase YbeY [Gaiellaceae bacterium]|nr:rRNA maturation RNase YbeY [Gaiellaceae bacterium]